MQRLATTVAIAAWIGFLGVFAIELSAETLSPGFIAAAASWPDSIVVQLADIDAIHADLAPPMELAIALACLSLVALLARSLYLLHAPRHSNIPRGEILALAGLACIAALAGAAQATEIPLLPIDLHGGLVWLAVALTIVAIGFDRLVAIETSDDRETEADFHSGFSALAERLGRQTALYTLPDTGRPDAKKDNLP